MKDTLILTDGTEMELEAGGDLGNILAIFPDKKTMVDTWSRLVPENLATVQIKNGDGLVRGNYADLVLTSETSIIQPDGAILTTFHLRPKTDVELITERLATVEESQAVQDGAIADLGEVTGLIAGQVMAEGGGA